MVTPNISETIGTVSSRLFNNLQAFSTYSVIVTAVYGDAHLSTSQIFNTLSAGKWQISDFVVTVVCMNYCVAPTAPPEITNYATTSTTVTIHWDPIECIKRNGLITMYRIEIQEHDEIIMQVQVNGDKRNFTVDGLAPKTMYTIRIAGVTSGGQGFFADITVMTVEVYCRSY